MSTVVVKVAQRADGRWYPAVPLTPAERWAVITLTHQLCHGQGLSQRAAQRQLLARGYRRSLGSICGDLSRPMCPACAGPPGD